jgi:transporter family-2 protein
MNLALGANALLVAALVAGALLPLQAMINARLGTTLASPLWASMAANFAGVATMGLALLAAREAPPSAERLAAAPWWAWTGGALGITYVLLSLLAAARLGATQAMVAIIVGQLAASVLLDQFGLIGDRRPINWQAAAGLALLVAGAVLVVRSRAA